MYIGNDLQIAHPSYKIIDDISSGFNGNTVSFALQVNGESPVPFPISTQQVTISVNGVIQEPDPNGNAGFKLLGSNIVFSSAPANGHAFFGVINAGADYVTAGSEFPDGSVTSPSFTFQADQDTGWFRSSSGAVNFSSNGVNKVLFDGNGLTVTGTCTATAFSGNGANLTNVTANAAAAGTLTGGTLASGVTASSLTSVGTLTSLTTSGLLTVQNTAPKIKLIDSDATGTPEAMLDGSGGDLYLEVDKDDEKGSSLFGIKIDGSEKMRIDSAGRVGIGTTSPNANVESEGNVSSTTQFSGFQGLRIQNANGAAHNVTADINFTAGTGSNNRGAAIGVQFTSAASGNDLYFATNPNQVSSNDTLVERMRIVSSGDVGIGTNSPTKPSSSNNSTRFMEIASGDGADLILSNNVSGNIGAGAHIGTLAFKNIDNSTGSVPHYAGIRCESVDTAGNMDLRFYTGINKMESDNPQLLLQGDNATFTGTVSDSKGELRTLAVNNVQGSAYTLVAADAGKMVRADNTVTLPTASANLFSAGQMVSVINNSGSAISLNSASGVALYNSATEANGNKNIAARGMVTIFFLAAHTAHVSGAGLTDA